MEVVVPELAVIQDDILDVFLDLGHEYKIVLDRPDIFRSFRDEIGQHVMIVPEASQPLFVLHDFHVPVPDLV